ncbi:ABC transporter permease [Verminephrobacter eiseniae]|uniref:ABC transporter permease n=1 Tax=Verminephrobacter eiseniae TaxID=364317 RepID=UPI002237AC98|nr:ABC transporter permease [Verminephrobacter eiseniae]MCW5235413.1 ABC transporter permease [Verminephrobacter eiseniae]
MKRILKVYLAKPELAAGSMLVLLALLLQATSGGVFLTPGNLGGVMGVVPEIGLVAVGAAVLMIAGEFDLSVGSVFAFGSMLACVLATHGWPMAASMPLALLCCAALGLMNGWLTLRFRIPSFITTLGMLFIVRSLTVVISGGFPPPFPDDAPTWLFTDTVGPLRLSMFWFLGLCTLIALVLGVSNYGNWIRATGGMPEAAQAIGIRTDRVKLSCFVLCSVLAGFAGMLQVMRLGSPLPSLGDGLELQAVAAAVIGGTALGGGVGTVLGAVIGVVLIRAIDNGMVVSDVDANWFKFAIGALTICAVIANSHLRDMAKKMKVQV